ncbi:MAG: sugar phosphate isomerase/epimerase [Verrucomicrobiota bacterium]
MDRRAFLSSTALLAAATSTGIASTTRRAMGVTIASYGIRWRNRKDPSLQPSWKDALDVLDHCQELGAGCLQIGVRGWTRDFAGLVRDKRESLGIHLEGQLSLPWEDNSLEKFESDVKAAKEAGATVLRTTCLGQRRYEKFETLEEWNTFVKESYTALERAEPIVAKHGTKLAFENHKDWRTNETLDLLHHLGSDAIGITFDFGNNLSLLENPMEMVEALAPAILSTHLKDMSMAEYEDGFLLSEVPLGKGILDLPAMMKVCSDANPHVWFNLEMITRDPLKVPVFEDKYWATMPEIPAPDLATILQLAKQGSRKALPQIAGKSLNEQISDEETHVRLSFDYSRDELGLL